MQRWLRKHWDWRREVLKHPAQCGALPARGEAAQRFHMNLQPQSSWPLPVAEFPPQEAEFSEERRYKRLVTMLATDRSTRGNSTDGPALCHFSLPSMQRAQTPAGTHRATQGTEGNWDVSALGTALRVNPAAVAVMAAARADKPGPWPKAVAVDLASLLPGGLAVAAPCSRCVPCTAVRSFDV